MVPAVAPFYSVLIQANPYNPTDTVKIYTFSIRGDGKLSDGSTMTAFGGVAGWNRLRPPSSACGAATIP